MHVEGSVTSATWIPTDVFKGVTKVGFNLMHYDETPPTRVTGVQDLQALLDADRLRMGNHLAAEASFVDGSPVSASYTGGCVIGSTHVAMGRAGVTFAGLGMPMIRQEPEYGSDCVRFVQTAGGRTGVPMPRKVPHPPYVQWRAPIAWTTLAITLFADGRVRSELAGASAFPRHWIYGSDGALAAKSGVMDSKTWIKQSFGDRTPWGEQDSPALVTAVESALESDLSHSVMAADKRPRIREWPLGGTIAEQGQPGDSLLILLDGIVSIIVDGNVIAEVGPGAVMGERALLENGLRTATLTARTRVRLAIADAADIDRESLEALAADHRREERHS